MNAKEYLLQAQTNRLWMEIYQIVKENCATEYNGATPQDDVMEGHLGRQKDRSNFLSCHLWCR